MGKLRNGHEGKGADQKEAAEQKGTIPGNQIRPRGQGASQVTVGEDASARARVRSPHDLEVTSGSVTCSGLELSELRGSAGAEVARSGKSRRRSV